MWRASPGPPLRQGVRGRYQGSSGLLNAMNCVGGDKIDDESGSERPRGVAMADCEPRCVATRWWGCLLRGCGCETPYPFVGGLVGMGGDHGNKVSRF